MIFSQLVAEVPRWLSALVFVAASAVPAAADVRFERLTIQEGLPGRYSFGLAQDLNGFLWIADIQDGLIRYDGHEFRAYRHNPADPGSLSSNEISSVHVDSEGTLWVATQAGLNRYDARADKFFRITTRSTEPAGLSSDGISCVLVDSAGRLWVGTQKGLNRLDPGAKQFRQYHVEQSAASLPSRPNYFWAAFEDSIGRLWFGTLSGGLLLYDPSSDSLKQFVFHDTPDSPPVMSVRSIAEDRLGQLWIAGDATLATLDPVSMTFRAIRFETPTRSVNELALPDDARTFTSVLEDLDGNVWISSNSVGVIRIAKDRRTWTNYRYNPNDRFSPATNDLWSSLVDRSGQLWFAGYGGLSRYNPLADAVDYVARPVGFSQSALIVLLAALPDGRLVAGTASHGAWVVDLATSQWKALPWPVGSTTRRIESLWVTADGAVWISSPDVPKLFRIDPDLARIKPFDPPDRPDILYVDSNGYYWLGISIVGLVGLDAATGAITKWVPDPKNPDSLSHDMVWDVFEDSSKNLWVGTYRGLDLMDRTNGTFKHYFPDPTDPDALPAHDVRRVVQDDEGKLWVHTTAGMSLYIPERDAFEYYPLRESPMNVTESTKHAPVANGRMWWGAATGLTSFDFKQRRYFLYGTRQGVAQMPSDVAALPDGRIAIAFDDRIGLFSLDRLRTDSTLPKVALTGIMLGARSLDPESAAKELGLDGSAWTATTLTLPHDHEPLTFEFAAPHFTDPARNRYSHLLEGLDREWFEADSRNRRATYTTLPPGRYTFRVKAANPDGLWNEDGLTFQLTILPPWWRTWWAYMLYGIAAVLMLMLTVRIRTQSLHARTATLERQVMERTQELIEQKAIVEGQAKRLEEIVETKDRLMTRISHEFRTPLAVILGPIDRLQSQSESESLRSYLDTAKRNASRLLRLVDQLLGLARLRSGHAEPTRPIAAAPIVRQVAASFESLAADRDLELTLESIADLTLQTTADALEKITVNLVSNAIKYSSRGGCIRISLAKSNDHTGTLTVSDTGRGISPDRLPRIFEPFERSHDEAERIPGSGLGLALVHELTNSHGGLVHVESIPGIGSTFRVSLPLASTQSQQSVAAVGVSEEGRVEVAALRAEVAATPMRLALPIVGATILIIEDNADMRTYLGQVLGDAYRLAFASDGNLGLEMAVAEIPDLIVCDIMLPGRDGYEVCHSIKTDERTSHIPVILLTALEGRDNRLKGLTEKADDYLTKPFDEAELRQRIANLLDLRAVLQRRFARDLRFDEAPPAELSQRDQSFLQKLGRLTASHHADPKFDLARLASAMAVGERNLQRKLQALVGLTPGEYLRAYRLQRAIERLRAGERSGDVAFAVGFSSQAYFSTCFRAQFGFPPSEARERAREH